MAINVQVAVAPAACGLGAGQLCRASVTRWLAFSMSKIDQSPLPGCAQKRESPLCADS